jgi:hypothetical protein
MFSQKPPAGNCRGFFFVAISRADQVAAVVEI